MRTIQKISTLALALVSTTAIAGHNPLPAGDKTDATLDLAVRGDHGAAHTTALKRTALAPNVQLRGSKFGRNQGAFMNGNEDGTVRFKTKPSLNGALVGNAAVDPWVVAVKLSFQF